MTSSYRSLAVTLHTIEISKDDAEIIFDFDIIYKIGSDPQVRLKPEIKQWCIENLRGNMAYPRAKRYYGYRDVWKPQISRLSRTSEIIYNIDFVTEHDVILFKLRWIG